MRIALAVLVTAVFACKNQPAPPSKPAAAPAAAGAIASNTLTGKVQETIDASQYTYLRIQTASGDVWAAVPTTKAAVGSEVTVQGPIWMENFQSKTLNRTWPRIAFGTLGGPGAAEPAPAQAESAAGLPAGHPSTAAPGMFAAQAAGSGAALPPGHPSPAPAADVGAIKVAKASGPQGRTIEDIYKARTQLKDKKVAVRGKVVKATLGVMGKNWLHLRDGTGAGATGDLTIASADAASVGDTVVVTGTVHLDRDLGAGYHYDVLVEDAKIQKE